MNNKTNFEFSHNLDLMHLLSIAALQKALKSFFNISISNKHLDNLLADLSNKNYLGKLFIFIVDFEKLAFKTDYQMIKKILVYLVLFFTSFT